MGSFVGTADRVYVNQLDLSGISNEVQFGTLTRTMKPCTTFNDGGFTCVRPALISGAAMIKGYQDYATGIFDDTISVAQLGSQYPVTVIPNPTGTVTAADTCWMSRALVGTLNPLAGSKGDMAGFELGMPYDTAIVQAKVAAPSAVVTTTGNGTAVAMAGPTASQKLYCALHVFAYSGFTNVVFTVESDDNSGFTTPTVRATFATATSLATGPQFISVAGAFNTETHHRIVRTVSGVGSITFAAAFGVI